ncbi:MAG: 3-deoxy-manno-octulosonate cytidylyltransferase [candidate division KSB1 bacterium]|nr:3-deoxy-manno-octulosonate cytidylyltransferase [candidate division KSB1 bacterium]MDZ7276046.1 3-deoxy-manno-octulosonate cytidylyltransferase [candidate division KSB1 bacterium]MDZ7285672.1 3-deoxy-manno-octulosonate cytidylyltransferase [candidate division KSB1 bacterium]MDZ7298704.1 3-deoxy-manno-octulosonate cytidylyltransferase [candidate division KSB1 bacterium]MDZ7307547.1 3-deoxy-manno-octulosonate cytidylyltransferase [candidate division KSB1 bacterium]
MNVLGVIPARYASTRFPGKPLARLLDRPMIQWVYERASQAVTLSELWVATDDHRIAAAVEGFGGRVTMTREDHPSGSDRIAEVAARMDPLPDLVVNIQGDEPLIDPRAIDLAVSVVLRDANAEFSTLACAITRPAELQDPNVVKIALAQDHTALYFSRSPIPYCRDCRSGREWLEHYQYLKHIGVYVFRRELLLKFVKWPPGHLERVERLEQLRLLERGVKIHVARTEYDGRSVDTPEDLEALTRELSTKSR